MVEPTPAELAQIKEALAQLIGVMEIASVMPTAIQKVYVPRLDSRELVEARAALAILDRSHP